MLIQSGYNDQVELPESPIQKQTSCIYNLVLIHDLESSGYQTQEGQTEDMLGISY